MIFFAEFVTTMIIGVTTEKSHSDYNFHRVRCLFYTMVTPIIIATGFYRNMYSTNANTINPVNNFLDVRCISATASGSV